MITHLPEPAEYQDELVQIDQASGELYESLTRAQLRDEQTHIIAYLLDETIIGYAATKQHEEHAQLMRVCVNERYRGSIDSLLVDKVLEQADENGHTHVATDERTAQQFYGYEWEEDGDHGLAESYRIPLRNH